MPLDRRFIQVILAGLTLVGFTDGGENWVTIGDSLTKEYAFEFPLLNPTNPAAWGERNWIELLSEHRSDQVDIGPLQFWADTRLTGHEHNWAFPGSTTFEWEERVTANDFFDDFEILLLRARLDLALREDADRVVIFLGGNDLKNHYGTYYDGADPAPFADDLVSNIRAIIDYVRDQNASVPIVLVNMPDVGVTPTVIESKPDPQKRQRNTDLTRDVNQRLRELAQQKEIGYADIGALTAELAGARRFVIGGIQFFKEVDPVLLSNQPQFLFSPDGFHPNTAAQLLFANAILRGFHDRYPELPPIPPFSTEEMLQILGLDPDMPLSQWASAYGVDHADPNGDVDGDLWPLIAEFVLGMDPRVPEPHLEPFGQTTEGRFELHYEVRVASSNQFQVIPQRSLDLQNWMPAEAVPPSSSHTHRRSAWIDTTQAGPGFLRLTFQEMP